MSSVSQNTNQKSTAKRSKIHRAHQAVSHKIIAFNVLAEAEKTKSAREIAKLIDVPNSTVQTWRKHEILKDIEEDEVGLFFRTPAVKTPGKPRIQIRKKCRWWNVAA